ncbi:rab11 family-interacting protein 5 isoform X2 [Electrophorus electricus]|uniref:rab11 family-interacting protein 5 isoform X2 n=1 Tax=Electrophorus electricus TaxID=8005 RepID=UPI0015CFD442|nr:rab11 family-interacting protein 5 isoform X2 [Electrophorus electricus]
MPLISLDDDDQRWVPTHVNAIVLRARGLRTKSKQGSRYVYTIVQVGKEKYTTGLVEKASEPEWNEECSFELLPGLLEAGPGACPPGNSNLVFTVMHRVLIGLDVFLGQAVVPLDKVFQDRMCPRSEWLKLHSKAGRKEKERGELQFTIRFTRNNMTASMYDLSVQEKPRSAFGRLKERVTGKKRVADVESSSAILPGRYAALSSSASQTFAEDGQGEMPGEEESGDERKSKMKDFFLKGKPKKSSDTHSCSSLASESSATSSAGDPFVPIELSSTPIYSSRVMEPFRTNSEGGGKVPEVMTHKRAYSDEASKIATASRSCPAVENLKGQGMPLSKSTLCINGSHIYTSEPVSPKSGLPVKRTLLEKCSPLSRSLQNLTRRGDDSQKADRRCGSIDGSRKEAEREAEGPAALGAVGLEGKPMQATAPMAAASGGMEGKKLKRTLFSSGRSDSLPAKHEQGQASGPQEGRLRGWFGSSDTQVKSSPHPVKPLITVVQGEKRSEGRSVLEKLRSSIHPGRSAQQAAAEPEKTQVWMSEARAHYQTLTNMELIALLLQQELEAEHQRAESELQATLLERREAELRKLKVQVRDLEDYIDKLLVRIMEQTPTLLQVRARPK